MYEDTKKICHYVGMVHICTKKSLGVEVTEGFCKGILQLLLSLSFWNNRTFDV